MTSEDLEILLEIKLVVREVLNGVSKEGDIIDHPINIGHAVRVQLHHKNEDFL